MCNSFTGIKLIDKPKLVNSDVLCLKIIEGRQDNLFKILYFSIGTENA